MSIRASREVRSVITNAKRIWNLTNYPIRKSGNVRSHLTSFTVRIHSKPHPLTMHIQSLHMLRTSHPRYECTSRTLPHSQCNCRLALAASVKLLLRAHIAHRGFTYLIGLSHAQGTYSPRKHLPASNTRHSTHLGLAYATSV